MIDSIFARISSLSPKKRELFWRRLNGHDASGARSNGYHDKQLVAYVIPRAGLALAPPDDSLYRLPNDLLVDHLNRNETDLIYQEIFEDRTYLQHGITLEEDACVFDVGANIGLFTLFIYQQCRRARVYAFEPSPPTFEKLRSNVDFYGLDAKLFQCALSNETREATFTFYPAMASMSGLYADVHEDEQVTRAFMLNQSQDLNTYADELMEGIFLPQSFVCQLRTLSDVIAECGLDRIDLLKIDVEKSELDVLEGIRAEDWKKIKQIVIEVHDIEGRLDSIASLLARHGYQCVVTQDALFKNTGLYNVYAIQPSQSVESIDKRRGAALEGAHALVPPCLPTARELRDYLKSKLPEHMVPARVLLLDAIPLTPNGKIDRRALSLLEASVPETEERFIAPRDDVETLVANVWAQALGLEQVSIRDNFFDLGGHSLLATQVVSRLRKAFPIELPLRNLFEAPTVEGLAAFIQSSLRNQSPSEAQPILPIPRDRPLPLSFAEERLWLLNQLSPQSPLYNVSAATRLLGHLSLASLELAFKEIVRRHEILRTTFASMDGQPHRIIAPEADFMLPLVDLCGLPKTEQREAVLRLATEETARPFDLESGPLMRATLLCLSPEEHALLLSMHHIVSDGWSMGVLVEELALLYEAYLRGEASPLEELTVQYVDYAAWQREWLQGERLLEQLSYWERQLADLPPVMSLPLNRPRPALPSFRGARQTILLPAPLSEALKDLSRREDVTLFMTLMACFQTLLYRYSGEPDVFIGTPIANRHHLEIENLIGCFINTLVLRLDLAGNHTFRELLARTRQTSLQAYAHQDLPFEMLVEALQPERDMSHAPLFQAMFVHQNAPLPTRQLPGLTLSPVEVQSGTAKYDLTLSTEDVGKGIICWIEYNVDVFEAATVARMLGHLENLLEGVTNDAGLRVTELPLLSQAEREQLLSEWNDTKALYPDSTLHQFFEEQAGRSPSLIAASDENGQVTYGELNRRANQLAHYLMKLGVGPEERVGICLERSIDMLVGLLAILKTGGAYVPLDTTYPQERIRYMLKDARVKAVLVREPEKESLAGCGVQLLSIDEEWEKVASESTENPESGVDGDNLAYVIYTSGSTGRPKGVMISHRSICNRVLWTNATFPLTAHDSLLQKTPFSFDASVWELFAPLFAGARVVMARPGGQQDSAYLAKVIAEQKITVLQMVPSMLQILVEEPEFQKCSSLKKVFCGGEALPVELQERFYAVQKASLHNLYGPTEVSIDASFWSTQPGVSQAGQPAIVPIGRPIANMRIYLLDSALQPLPVGAAGELHVGGVGLARGYLNRPELTAEKFVPDPFGQEPGARLYKTGDLARYLPDGTLHYLGRVDEQVKLRGYRIELGEIEAVLASHPGVREALVVLLEDNAGDKRLVAYLVANQPGRAPSVGKLRGFLRERLPEYMLPSSFVTLEALPLLPNGKVNRKALPGPQASRPELDEVYTAPSTPLEKLLTGIWSDVLRIKQVGVHDTFFDLGGNSLLAVRVLDRLNKELQKSIPLVTLFQYPTIHRLTQFLSGELGAGADLKKGESWGELRRQARRQRQPKLRA